MTGQSAIRDLGAAVKGEVLVPADAGYDDARRVHNGMIDKRPAVIVRASGASDVGLAVQFGRENGLEISVRGGGHNVAGRAVTEGGLMIDLSLMKRIEVDPSAKSVRAEAGVTWAEFNAATQEHGLAATGGIISTTGVSGLTLGGGIGWLMGRFGLAADNLLSAEVVTADNNVLTASAEENADLFWALRGGGGNFGVVTALEFKLHEVGPTVHGGLVAYAISDAGTVLRGFRRIAGQAPDELGLMCGLLFAPDGSGTPIVAIPFCHTGDAERAEATIAELRGLAAPVMDAAGPIEYSAVNQMLDGGFPRGALNYWKSTFLDRLSDDAIAVLLDQFASCPSPMSAIVLENFGGAVTRVAPDAIAFAHRQAGINLLVIGQWADPGEGEKNTAWVRATYEAMRPFMSTWKYMNYLGDDAAAGDVENAYGSNYERLRAIKRRYDPANLFHLNQNIVP